MYVIIKIVYEMRLLHRFVWFCTEINAHEQNYVISVINRNKCASGSKVRVMR